MDTDNSVKIQNNVLYFGLEESLSRHRLGFGCLIGIMSSLAVAGLLSTERFADWQMAITEGIRSSFFAVIVLPFIIFYLKPSATQFKLLEIFFFSMLVLLLLQGCSALLFPSIISQYLYTKMLETTIFLPVLASSALMIWPIFNPSEQ